MTKNRVLSCSTPERHFHSMDSDSDSVSPVQFLCTQDGVEGEVEVVWNFYTPKSGSRIRSVPKISTPVSSRTKNSLKSKETDRPISKRKLIRDPKKRNEILQELYELNKNLEGFISKNPDSVDKEHPKSDDDIFNNSPEHSPKSGIKSNFKCLRRNLLSSKFVKNDNEAAIESDDSINEYLIKASQQVENNIPEPTNKKALLVPQNKNIDCHNDISMENDSIDNIFKDFKFENYTFKTLEKGKIKCPKQPLDESVFDQLTQEPLKCDSMKQNKTKVNYTGHSNTESSSNFNSPSTKSIFTRHNSMPESPSTSKQLNMSIKYGRHCTMPLQNAGLSPNKCTEEEIKKKHQQAKEKLLAKRLPFTIQKDTSILKTSVVKSKSNLSTSANKNYDHIIFSELRKDKDDMKSLIEKKRQEALLKLRSRRHCVKKL